MFKKIQFIILFICSLCFSYSQQIYHNSFSSATAFGNEWSLPKFDSTPNGARGFLGQFANQSVGLYLTNLPKHSWININFDLYVIRTWDGCPGNYSSGPDRWKCYINGFSPLIDTTFANHPGQKQNYPYSITSGISVPRYYLASEVNTLGFSYWSVGPIDSVYNIPITTSHTASSILLKFEASGLEGVATESWGLDNVNISVSKSLISGKVGLLDFAGDSRMGFPLELQIEDVLSGVTFTYNCLLDKDGNFNVGVDVPAGNYNIYLKSWHWLREKISNVVINDGVVNIGANLINGDIDGDNTISVFDYSIFSDYFIHTSDDSDWTIFNNSYRPIDADLDCDGAVSVFDYAILSENFDKIGK